MVNTESHEAPFDTFQAAEDLEAVRQGYAQAQAGELMSFEDFDKEFRAKHGLFRSNSKLSADRNRQDDLKKDGGQRE